MKYIKQYLVVCAVFSLLIVSACSDDWDGRTDATDPKISDKSLLQMIQEDPNLSEFYELLQETGYDQTLAATSASFSGMTVFAPNNAALTAAVGTERTAAELEQIVENHISLTSNVAGLDVGQQRIKMANMKGLTFDSEAGTVDGVAMVTSNKFAKNGTLHIINEMLQPRPSVWEFIRESDYWQSEALKELTDYTLFDEESQILGYTPEGEAIYDSLFFELNRFIETVPVDNEDSLYIHVVLVNEAYERHHYRYARILRQIDLDETFDEWATDSMSTVHMNADLLFRVPKVNGVYDFALHPVMKSTQGVNVYFNTANVVSQQQLSNGYLYVVSDCQIPLQNNKVKPIWIEGESTTQRPHGDFPGDSIGARIVRLKSWASGGKVLFYNQRHFRFRPVVFSVPYKFFWRIGNDEASDTVPMRQRLYISNPGAFMVEPNINMAIPGMGTTTSNGHVRYNSIDPDYPDAITYPNLRDQATTYYFFSAVQDTVRDARRTISPADTSRNGWFLIPRVEYKVTDGYTYISTNPGPTAIIDTLSDSQIQRVRNGETIDIGWIARPDYLTEKQLYFSTMTFPVQRDGETPVTTFSNEDLARIEMNYDEDTYTFLSYGNAGLAVNRDYRARNNYWSQFPTWSNAVPPVFTLTDFRGVYLDYMRLEPALDDEYEGFPVVETGTGTGIRRFLNE